MQPLAKSVVDDWRARNRVKTSISGEFAIIDGDEVLYHLWCRIGDRAFCGGDFAGLIKRLQEFVFYVVATGVKPFFVFDGICNPTVYKQEAWIKMADTLPSMHLSLVATALEPLDVPFYFAPVKVNALMACLARKTGALVIGRNEYLPIFGVRIVDIRDVMRNMYHKSDPSKTKFLTLCGRDFVKHATSALGLGGSESLQEENEDHSSTEATSFIPIETSYRKQLRLALNWSKCEYDTVKETAFSDLARRRATLDDSSTFWKELCEEAKLKLAPNDFSIKEVQRGCDEWILNRFMQKPCQPLFVNAFLKAIYDVPGYWFPDANSERIHDVSAPRLADASRDPIFACRDLLTRFAKLLSRTCRGMKRWEDICLVNRSLWNDDVTMLLQWEACIGKALRKYDPPKVATQLLYEMMDMADMESNFEGFSGWRRTVVIAFRFWSYQRHYPLDAVFVKAAVLTHMCVSGLLPIPDATSSLALTCMECPAWETLIGMTNEERERWAAAARLIAPSNLGPLGAYEALKAVATWLDALLTLLGNPLPAVRPEKIFNGKLFLFFTGKLTRGVTIESIISRFCYSGRVVPGDRVRLASNYMRSIFVLCKMEGHESVRINCQIGIFEPKARTGSRHWTDLDCELRDDDEAPSKRRRLLEHVEDIKPSKEPFRIMTRRQLRVANDMEDEIETVLALEKDHGEEKEKQKDVEKELTAEEKHVAEKKVDIKIRRRMRLFRRRLAAMNVRLATANTSEFKSERRKRKLESASGDDGTPLKETQELMATEVEQENGADESKGGFPAVRRKKLPRRVFRTMNHRVGKMEVKLRDLIAQREERKAAKSVISDTDKVNTVADDPVCPPVGSPSA